LLNTDTQQLHLIGLEKSNTEREVDAHYPEFNRAQKMSVDCVRQHDLDQIQMKEAGCRNCKWNIPHLEIRVVSMGDEPCNPRIQDDGP
jgi:hypothetical protein